MKPIFKLSLALLTLTFAACGDGDEAEPTLGEEIDTFVSESNADARKACKAPADVDQQESGESEAVACYFELAVEIEPCERAALEKYPEQARDLMDCIRAESESVIECCSAGECTDTIESCVEELDPEELTACDIQIDELNAALESCE